MTRLQTRRDARAFTLVEMIVTLVVISILVSLSLFGAVSFMKRSHDSDARERLHEVTQLEQSLANTWGSYSEAASDFSNLSGSTSVTHLASSGPSVVSTNVGTQGTLGLAVKSASGRCLYVRVASLLAGGDALDVTSDVPKSAPCRGTEALPAMEGSATPPQGPTPVKTL